MKSHNVSFFCSDSIAYFWEVSVTSPTKMSSAIRMTTRFRTDSFALADPFMVSGSQLNCSGTVRTVRRCFGKTKTNKTSTHLYNFTGRCGFPCPKETACSLYLLVRLH